MTGWDSVYLMPGSDSEKLLGVDHVAAWDGFAAFIEARRKADPGLTLYLDEGGQGLVGHGFGHQGSAAQKGLELPYAEARETLQQAHAPLLRVIVAQFGVVLMAWYGAFSVLGPVVAREHLGGPAGASTKAVFRGIIHPAIACAIG